MELRELKLQRLPGIERPFAIQPGDAVNLVVGPNGAGKSSLMRAFLRLLWPDFSSARPSEVSARLVVDGRSYEASRLNDEAVVWRHQDVESEAPPLPPAHLARCYRLGMLDLNRPDGNGDDAELGREVLTRMAGGYDLAELAGRLFPRGARAGLKERDAVAAAQARRQEVARKQQQLAERQDHLGTLKAAREEARLAAPRRAQLERLLEIRELRTELAVIDEQLQSFPAAIDRVRPEDPENWRELEDRGAETIERIARLDSARLEQEERHAELFFPAGIDAPELLGRLETRLVELQTRHEEFARLGRELAELENDDETGSLPHGVTAELYRQIEQLHVDRIRAEAGAAAAQARLRNTPTTRRLRLILGSIGAALGAIALSFAAWWTALPDAAPTASFPTAWLIVAGAALLTLGALALGTAKKAGTDQSEREKLSTAESDRDRIDADIGQLARKYDLDLGEPNLLYALKAAALAHEQSAERDRFHSRHGVAEREWKLSLARFNEELAAIDHSPCDDLPGAVATVGGLKERRSELNRLAEDLADGEQTLAEYRTQADREKEALYRLLARLDLPGIADPAGRIAELAKDRPRWEELSRRHETLRTRLRQFELRAKEENDLIGSGAAGQWTDEQLTTRIAEETERSERFEDLVIEITSIENEIESAFAGDELATALAAAESATVDLRAVRGTSREAALGRWLIKGVRSQNESHSQPAVWKAAVGLFGRFTHYEWELRVHDRDGGGRFAARETATGAVRGLTELSDGTRAQLLLAVRLGFLQVQETEVRPPLFVDDALTSSDPVRFDAVAGALGELAAEHHRQVFYLTADPADAARFEAALAHRNLPTPRRIDLAEVRALAGAADPASVADVALAPVPAPSGSGLSAYAELLHVPELDPWCTVDAIHLARLTNDDFGELELLHRLLSAGAETVGRRRRARRHLIAAGVLTAEQDRELEFRTRILEASLSGWRIGRARPLNRQDLEQTSAVSDKMLPAVWAEAERLDREGARLVASLRAHGVKNFKQNKADELESYLAQEELLAAGETYTDAELVLHVVKSLGTDLRDTNTETVRYWIGRFLRAVEPRGRESAAVSEEG